MTLKIDDREYPRTVATERVPLVSLAAAIAGLFFFLPLIAVFIKLPVPELLGHLRDPETFAALSLSLRTTSVALGASVAFGMPLAYWLAHSRSRFTRLIETLMQMPVVVPPAVAGVGLLLVFGRSGLLGPALGHIGITIPFTWIAVVLAQIFTGAPFFIISAKQAFDSVDRDLTGVARTLGSTAREAFVRITLPLALSGLLSGAALCWARSLGEFGATIVFAARDLYGARFELGFGRRDVGAAAGRGIRDLARRAAGRSPDTRLTSCSTSHSRRTSGRSRSMSPSVYRAERSSSSGRRAVAKARSSR